jgi:hypothetical protein
MGHTERGSFVIPILVPVPPPESEEVDSQESLYANADEFRRVAPEPFERRVVRTFAQSMQAVHDIVQEPSGDPDPDQIYELVYRGVSREFRTALSSILSEPEVAKFGARVEWAAGIQAPETLSQDVTIDAGATELLERVSDKLRRQPASPRQIFSGTIVQLRHEERDDPFGEIAISTVRHGRQAEISVKLALAQYRQAWDWHSAGRAVLVEGTVAQRSPGRRLWVERPVRCHPVDETVLV